MTPTQQAVQTYYDSWQGGTFDRAKFDEAIASDVKFRGSIDSLDDADGLAKGVEEFIQLMQDITFHSRIFDGDEAFVLYTCKTGPIGDLRLAEHFVVRDGKVAEINLTFDSHRLRPLIEHARAQQAAN